MREQKKIGIQIWMLLSLLTGSIFIWNCQKEIDLNQIIESSEHVLDAKTVSKEEIDPRILSFLQTKTEFTDVSKKTSKSEDYQTLINYDNIKKVVDKIGNTNYTFTLEVKDNNPATFYNVIVNENIETSQPNISVHKFESEPASLENFVNNNYDFRFFRGTIFKYSLSNFMASHSNVFAQRTRGADDCPCDQVSVDGQSSGNGISGGGSDFGNFGGGNNNVSSGGGSSSNGGSYGDDCDTYTYVQGCGGPNEDRWHLGTTCGDFGAADAFLSVLVCGGSPDEFLQRSNNEDDCNNPCGGTGSGGSVAINTPNVNQQWNNFVSTLGREERAYVASSLAIQGRFRPFLNSNNYSQEAEEFAGEILELAFNDSAVSLNAFSFALEAFTQDKIENTIDHEFLKSVNQYMYIDTDISSENTDPIVQYFIAKIAVLKALNPDWSNTKVLWEATKDVVHIGLDIFGMVPVVGVVGDLVNGALYTIEGDGVNATLSLASAIPVVGQFSTATKYGVKIIQATTIGTKVKLVWKVTAEGIEFGSRKTLRKVLGLTDATKHAHHLIPWALRSNPVVQKAAKSIHAFHLNEALNGIPRLSNLHLTGHSIYNNKITEILNDFNELNSNATFDEAYEFTKNLANRIRDLINANPNLNSGQIADLI